MPRPIKIAKYFDRGHYPVYVGVVFSVEELQAEFRRLNIPVDNITATTNTDAPTMTLESQTGGRICLVYISLAACKERPYLSEVSGICSHEATHVWQSVKEYIGEKHPGEEQEAYYIQYIAQNLFSETINRLRVSDKMTKAWDKKSTKKMTGKLKGKEGYSGAKKAADKKFGKKTSAVKNIWISKKMKED